MQPVRLTSGTRAVRQTIARLLNVYDHDDVRPSQATITKTSSCQWGVGCVQRADQAYLCPKKSITVETGDVRG